jgi:hypothetical protein
VKLNQTPIVVAAGANSVAIPTDSRQNTQQYGISVVITGSPTYTVAYTLDDVYAPGYNPATGNWTAITALSAQTTTKQVPYQGQATAFQLQVAAGTGSAAIQVWQADSAMGA